MALLEFIVVTIVSLLLLLLAGYLMECNKKSLDEGFNVNLRGFGSLDWIFLTQKQLKEYEKKQ